METYNKETLIAEGFTEALWRYKDVNGYKLGPIYQKTRINGELSQVFINEDGDVVILHPNRELERLVPCALTNSQNSRYNFVKVKEDAVDEVGGIGWFAVHRIMAYTYLGMPPEDNFSVDHIDGRSTHNSITNLRWMSIRENRSLRQFGSRASKDEKRLGRDADYDIRRNRINYNTIKAAAIEDDYDDYLDETQEFLDRYI